jgi:HlyD family secretion protein
MKKSWIWIISILVVVIIVLVSLKKAGIIGKEEATKVSSEKVMLRTVTEIVSASGKVYPEVEVKISPDVSGEIVELTIQEGDSVLKGQLLARVYADILATQRDQATAGVNQQQALVQNSSAALESFKARFEQAQRQYNRQKQLYEQKVISRLEFEQAESAYLTSKADFAAASQTINSGKAGVQSAQASLQRANKDLSRTSVLSPMSGVVSLLNVKKGERVVGNSMMAGTEMMRIADMRVIEVRVDVGENDVPKVQIGDSAIVEVDAYTNKKFKGVVTQIASSNRSGTGASVVATTDVTNYEVRIRLDPSSYQDLIDPAHLRNFPFRPGMSATADIQTRTHKNVLSISINAVTTRDKNDTSKVSANEKPKSVEKADETQKNTSQVSSSAEDVVEVVFILLPDNTVKRVEIKTDIQDLKYIEVLSGLKAGDEVITGPYTVVSKLLRNGMKVTVVPREQLFEVKK